MFIVVMLVIYTWLGGIILSIMLLFGLMKLKKSKIKKNEYDIHINV